MIEVACGLSPRGWRFTAALRRSGSPTSRPTCRRWRRASARRWSGWARCPSATASSSSTRCATTAHRAWPRSRRARSAAAGWRSSPRGCSATCPATRSTALWRRFAAALRELQRRALHLRSPPRRRPDHAGAGVPGAALGVRARPGASALRERARGRGGAAREPASPRRACTAPPALAPEIRGPGSELAHIIEASTR